MRAAVAGLLSFALAGTLSFAQAGDADETARQERISKAIETSCLPLLRPPASTGDEPGMDAAGRAGRFYDTLPDPLALLSEGKLPPECEAALREKQPEAGAHEDALKATTQKNSSDLARSFDSAASNPASLSLVERGGAVEAATLALRNSNFVSADDSAVTLRLAAASLFCDKDSGSKCVWDRLAGAVTFGSKVPEKEVVGFSGFPDAERLLDVLVWDASLRLVGDRRPDSYRWRAERNAMALSGAQLALAGSRLARPGDSAAADLAEIERVFNERASARYVQLQERIGSSLLVTASFSGQHLTQEEGKNKYTATLMVDKGLGKAGFTFNASYNSVQDVSVADAPPVTLKTLRLAAALSGDFLKGVLVDERSTEWSLAGRLLIPNDGDIELDRERVYELALDLRFPVSGSAHVPIVVTFTNDPNSLSKQRFVRGQVGINYDFGALKKLLKG